MRAINGRMDISTKVMVTLFSLFAEVERDLISKRTRQGLASAKAKGKRLGNPRIKEIIRMKRNEARKFAETLRPTLEGFISIGMSQRAIVRELNELGIKAMRGGNWSQTQVQYCLEHLNLKTLRSKT